MSDYTPEFNKEKDSRYLLACHELYKDREFLEVFLDSMFKRLIARTFFPVRDEGGNMKEKTLSLESTQEVANLIKSIPIYIKVGSDLYLKKEKEKNSN